MNNSKKFIINNTLSKYIIYAILFITMVFFLLNTYKLFFLKVTINRDYMPVYLSTVAWSENKDPYDHNLLTDILKLNENDIDEKPNFFNRPSLYPPTIFPIFYPLSIFNFYQSLFLMNILNIIAFFATIYCLLLISNFNLKSIYGMILLIFCFSLGPIRDNLNQGNPALLSLMSLLYSFYADRLNYKKISGLLLGISLALKPQIGIPLFIYFALRKNWQHISVTLMFLFCLFLIALRFSFNNFILILSYLNNVKLAFSAQGVNDTSLNAIGKDSIINLSKLLGLFFWPDVVSFIVVILAIIFLILYLLYCKDKLNNENLFPLSYLTIYCLLFFYHRFADGILLLIPLLYGLILLKKGFLNYFLSITFLGWLPFLFCFNIQIKALARNNNSYNWLINGAIGEIINVYSTLALLGLFGVFQYLLFYKSSAASRSEEPVADTSR